MTKTRKTKRDKQYSKTKNKTSAEVKRVIKKRIVTKLSKPTVYTKSKEQAVVKDEHEEYELYEHEEDEESEGVYSLPTVESLAQSDTNDGCCTECGQVHCDCSEEMDFSLSVEESPMQFKCKKCRYTTTKKEYYVNHVGNCDYNGEVKRELSDIDVQLKDKKTNFQRSVDPNYKKKMCKSFMTRGRSKWGSECTVKHEKGDDIGFGDTIRFNQGRSVLPEVRSQNIARKQNN